jgi:hypothetical protein
MITLFFRGELRKLTLGDRFFHEWQDILMDP